MSNKYRLWGSKISVELHNKSNGEWQNGIPNDYFTVPAQIIKK